MTCWLLSVLIRALFWPILIYKLLWYYKSWYLVEASQKCVWNSEDITSVPLHCSTFYSLNRTWWKTSKPSQLRVMIWILPHYSMMYPRVLFFFILYTQSLYEITDYRSAVHHMFVDDLYKVCWSFWYQLSQLKVMIWIQPLYSILVRIWHQLSQLRVMIWILPPYSMVYSRVLFFFVLYTQSLYEIIDYCSAPHHMFMDDLYKVCWSFWYQLSGHFYAILC